MIQGGHEQCLQVVESIADMLLDDVLQQSAAGKLTYMQ